MSDLIPKDLLLEPESRRPLVLPESTVSAVLAPEVPAVFGQLPGRAQPGAGPLVSIIVVSFNNLVFTRLCLESALANTDLPAYELIVVDNGSSDGSVDYLLELARLNEPVSVRANEQNLGFARACNQGLCAASGDVLILLNNDTVVPPAWIHGLIRRLEQPDVGMAGPVTNRCGNEAEIETSYQTYGEFLEFAQRLAQKHENEDRELPMLIMFCVAFRRSVFEQIGLLDERFEVGLFEDEDYSMRLAEAGYTLVCAEDVLVHHFGQASIGKLAASGEYGKLFHTNRARFEEKWGLNWRPHGHRPRPEYSELVDRIRRIVESTLPPGTTVIIASKGDEDLLTLTSRRAWHFPQENDGSWSGHHPADSATAIRQLERLRDAGGEYLILPASMFWWLPFYPEFAAHLADHYPAVEHEDVCLVYHLTGTAAEDRIPVAGEFQRAVGISRLTRKLITVIVPVQEVNDQLEDFLGLLLERWRHPYRLLLIDDSGERAAWAHLEEFAGSHKHVALAATEGKRGRVAVVNLGCGLAPGDVVVMNTSSDPVPQWLEKMTAAAYSEKRVALVESPGGVFITRPALRKAGPFDDAGFSDWTLALVDFHARTAALGFVHLVSDAARIDESISVSDERPCLLAVVHSGSGGSRFSTEDLILGLSDSCRCLLLETGVDHWSFYEVVDAKLKLSRQYRFQVPWRLDAKLGEERRAVLADICVAFSVDLVNVHHLLGNGPEVLEYLDEEGLPVVFSFHDYYTVCPTAHLIDNNGESCGGTCSAGPGVCPVNPEFFQASIPVLKHRYVYQHRERMEAALGGCQAYTVPSRSAKRVLMKSLRSLRGKDIHLIGHGRDLTRLQSALEPNKEAPAKIVCIGNLNPSKGTGLIRELMQLDVQQGRRFEFHFLGRRPRHFRAEEFGGVCHGAYQRDELLSLLKKTGPSFSLLASVCEETFSFTLSESWAAGIPVFASNRGALAERIEKHGGGWLFDPDNAAEFYAGMVGILDTPGAWRRQTEIIKQIPLGSMAAEAEKMKQLFDSLHSQRRIQ